jgi:lipopolysaccharide/colanic/teichoic acid biosynthesis glycosyltransferase/dTDP-glucose pyrophosphorylase
MHILTRLFDILVSLIGCIIFFLVLPIFYVLIKLDSPGPVFFPCDRVGKDGKLFKMYKLRTMHTTDAPVGDSVSPQGDPRVTRVGRVLRRLKLNELPQFINVLKGDMTLIGPRPEAPDLAAAYPPEAKVIFSVKPGLMGPNQFIGRNEEELYPPGVDAKKFYLENILPQKLALDLDYLQKKSFLKDLAYLSKCLWATVSDAVQRRHLTDNVSQIAMLLADTVLCPLSFMVAYLIRFEKLPFGLEIPGLPILLIFTILTRIPILLYLGCYQGIFRFLGLRDFLKVGYGVTAGSIFFVISAYFNNVAFSRSIFIIDWFCLLILLTGYRMIGKIVRQLMVEGKAAPQEKRRALIWGAGDEGQWCLNFLKEKTGPSFEILGFIDENPQYHHKSIDGCRVLGNLHHLPVLAKIYKVEELILASPALPSHKIAKAQEWCKDLGITLSRFSPGSVQELIVSPNSHYLDNGFNSSLRAVILAGGKGVRLAPLTEVIPKPMVPIGGIPILEIVIRRLKAQGIDHITLAVGYMADLIRAYFQDGSRWNVTIDYSHEDAPLGTAGPLGLIKGLQDTFLVMNADILTDINHRDLVKHHRKHGGLATVATFEKEVNIDLGVVVKDGGLRIKDYIEKPTNRYLVSMGIYVFEPEVLKFIPEQKYLDFPDLIKLLLQADLPVNLYPFSGYWMDIGRHDDYAKANKEFKAFLKKSLLLDDFKAA